MKIKSGFVLRDICGENVVVSEGLENIDFSEIITLNETAAHVWNAVKDKDFTIDDAVKALLEDYDVEESVARTDCEKLIGDWLQNRLVE